MPLTVFGLAAHAYSLAASVRLLDEAGCGVTMVPLVRQILECAVTAMWVEQYGERTSLLLLHEDARSRVQMFTKFVEGGYPDDGAVEEWQSSRDLTEPDAKTPGARFFERCQELNGMERSYAFYRGLSLVSHADGGVTDLYHRESDAEDPLGVLVTSIPAEWAPHTMLGLALTYLLLAATAWDHLDQAHPAASRLFAIGSEMGLALEWSKSPVGIQRQETWETNRFKRRSSS